jgi:hypothetical protein
VPTRAPCEAVGNEGIARIFALPDRGQHEAGRQFHRHVLQRVHGKVRTALLERRLELLHEEALATHLRQRAVEDLVAAGGHAQQLDGQAEALGEHRPHMFGLPDCQAALAGGDGGARKLACGHAAIIASAHRHRAGARFRCTGRACAAPDRRQNG